MQDSHMQIVNSCTLNAAVPFYVQGCRYCHRALEYNVCAKVREPEENSVHRKIHCTALRYPDSPGFLYFETLSIFTRTCWRFSRESIFSGPDVRLRRYIHRGMPLLLWGRIPRQPVEYFFNDRFSILKAADNCHAHFCAVYVYGGFFHTFKAANFFKFKVVGEHFSCNFSTAIRRRLQPHRRKHQTVFRHGNLFVRLVKFWGTTSEGLISASSIISSIP